MSKKVLCFLAFLVGAASGGAASYFIIKRKADEEISKNNKEAREYYDKKVDAYIKSVSECEQQTKECNSTKEARKSADILNDRPEPTIIQKDETFDDEQKPEQKKMSFVKDDIEKYKKLVDIKTPIEGVYVIDPNSYGENEEYKLISLNLFKDGIIADNNNEILEDPYSILGEDWPNYFGVYANKAVYVRNDTRRCDYEIILVNTSFY